MSKMFNYEADQIHDMVHPDLLTDTTHYVAECKDIILNEITPNYPKLTEYEKEWLYFGEHVYQDGHPVNLEYQSLEFEQKAMVQNAIPFYYKSAILKGNTLMNKLKSGFGTNPIGISTATKAKYTLLTELKEGKDYTISFDLEDVKGSDTLNVGFGWGWAEQITASNGRHTIKFPKERVTTESTFIAFYFHYSTTSANVKNVVVVEGSFDDIPYFEGMQSVKMPVLTTTGKNLMPVNHARLDGIDANTGGHVKNLIAKNIPVTPGKTYTVSYSVSSSTNVQPINITRYEHQEKTNSNSHNQLFSEIGKDDGRLTFTIPQGINYISFTFGNAIYTNNGIPGWIQFDNIQLQDGTVATEYEPYKSNISTANEPVELRGIGDVQDTLDLLTGEVTERIEGFILDGSDDELIAIHKQTDNNTLSFSVRNMLPNEWYKRKIICDKLSQNFSVINDVESFSHGDASSTLYIRISKSKLTSLDVTGIRNYLSSNPLTFEYELATESIKTVDLSGDTIKPYEGTNHYYTSSDTIPPSCQLSVPIESTGAKTLNEITMED